MESPADGSTSVAAPDRKLCFVIAPIGSDGSDIRRRSDQVLRHIIRPAVEPLGFRVVRGDGIDEPGLISSQVIDLVISADLAIADLTDHNPNVFYELGVRHAFGKPVIHIIDQNAPIPFDVAAQRTVKFTVSDLDSAANCTEQIAAQVRAICEDESRFDNPVKQTADLASLRRSGSAEERLGLQTLDAVAALARQVSELGDYIRGGSIGGRVPRRIPGNLSSTSRAVWEDVVEDLQILLSSIETDRQDAEVIDALEERFLRSHGRLQTVDPVCARLYLNRWQKRRQALEQHDLESGRGGASV